MHSDHTNNKKKVLEYFELTFNQLNPGRAAADYLHENYIHHGYGSGSSRLEFIEYFTNFVRKNPLFKAEILQSLSEGDMVVLRVETRESEFSTPRMAAEFYRLEDGKIKEHWHVVESMFHKESQTICMR